ncbi:MAG TPA: hypothetical protein VFV58_34965 [Blastocatellia bacterium]|jgi:hypothetical protein|nr:hypothetical protein [Blastocatellia bacterium]
MARRKQIETIIDYPELRAQMARLGLTYEDFIRLAQETIGSSPNRDSVSDFLHGAEGMRVETIKRYASVIGMRPRVVFERIEASTEVTKASELKAA